MNARCARRGRLTPCARRGRLARLARLGRHLVAIRGEGVAERRTRTAACRIHVAAATGQARLLSIRR